jgi:hypothetical protein
MRIRMPRIGKGPGDLKSLDFGLSFFAGPRILQLTPEIYLLGEEGTVDSGGGAAGHAESYPTLLIAPSMKEGIVSA